jgi:ribosome-associated translation inhibitor RaiA
MKVQIHCQGKLRSAALVNWARQQLAMNLARFSEGIKSIRVRLVDTNGVRGGIDKRAEAVVSLRDGSVITTEVRDEDAYRSFEWLARQLRFQVQRRVDRLRGRRRVRYA